MKKIQLLVIISLIFFTASCQKDKGVQFYNLGSEFFISSPGYTSLDSQAVLSIKNISKNLTKVNVINLGGTLANDSAFISSYTGSIAIAGDGTGSTTLSDSDLGMDGIGASAKFEFDATYNGKPFSRFYTLTEADPISVDAPMVTRSSKPTYLYFDISPVSATVTGVKVQTKVGVNSTYTTVAGTFAANDSVPIVGSNYNLGDTLYVNVIGSAGAKTANTETAIAIQPNTFPNAASFKLDSTSMRAYDLVGDSAVTVSDITADIKLAVKLYTGGFDLGFSSPNNTLFVKGMASDYKVADQMAIAATDFSSAVTSVANVSVGDVYIFKTMRGTTTHYGVMEVTAVVKPQGVLDDSYITIEYKY